MFVEFRVENVEFPWMLPAVAAVVPFSGLTKNEAVLMAEKFMRNNPEMGLTSAHVFMGNLEIVVSKVTAWMSNNG